MNAWPPGSSTACTSRWTSLGATPTCNLAGIDGHQGRDVPVHSDLLPGRMGTESEHLHAFLHPEGTALQCQQPVAPEAYEDSLGQPYRDCPKIDGNTFPGLAPMVATVLEWGHSLTDDQWSVLPADQKEFKLNVSERLLNSISANYLLNDTDHDSHPPLLLTVHATHYSHDSPGRAKAMNRNPETLQEKAERRRQRQKENKARGSSGAAASTDPSSPPREAGSGASSGATASGSQRLAEPADPPGGKTAGKGSKGGKSSKGKSSGGKSSWGRGKH